MFSFPKNDITDKLYYIAIDYTINAPYTLFY